MKDSSSLDILVVEDEPQIQTLVKRLLRENQITAFENPQQALESGKVRYRDLIITDYHMPGMNGSDFVRRIRAQGLTIPIIGISGENQGESFKDAGANYFIKKDGSFTTELPRAVRTYHLGLLAREIRKGYF